MFAHRGSETSESGVRGRTDQDKESAVDSSKDEARVYFTRVTLLEETSQGVVNRSGRTWPGFPSWRPLFFTLLNPAKPESRQDRII